MNMTEESHHYAAMFDSHSLALLNPKMTYVHICQHMYKTPLEIYLYIWATRKFTAFVRHAA